jgi:hypothetical protein
LTEAVSYARKKVSGHADRFDALAAFATLAPPLDEAKTRQTAEEMLDGSISHIFSSSTLSSDFRKVAASPGSSGQVDEAVVWSEMVKVVIHNAQFIGKGIIAPALEVLNVEHQFGRSWLVSLCTESPSVPEGHEMLWGTGLALGLAGNHGAAVSMLVPQLEQVVRVMLRRNDVHTLFVDEHGVESEKSLNALLDMPETEAIFGSGMVMEMKAMLVVQGGPNLRNDIAHGLLSDGSAWSYSALYMWWFCLRLVMYPVIEMVEAGRAQAATDSAAKTASEPQESEEAAAEETQPEAGESTEEHGGEK